ncbi:ATP-binding protein [Succinimonas amylolytica]|uniref:ATP-binding protein n=1 Tax=Succinimonas amylolytica TaxID=83769 RepID=UPI0014616F70|nr:ATP-binding protein [Succinimonas amylolytica]
MSEDFFSTYSLEERNKIRFLLHAFSEDRETWQRFSQKSLFGMLKDLEHVFGEREQYEVLIRSMHTFVSFNEVAVLSRTDDSGDFSLVYVSDPALKSLTWTNSAVLKKCFRGEIQVLYDPADVPDFQGGDPALRDLFKSAMLIPLLLQDEKFLFICLSRQRFAMNLRSRRDIMEVLPVFTQAMINLRYRNQLEQMVRTRTRSLLDYQDKVKTFRRLSYEMLWQTDDHFRMVHVFAGDQMDYMQNQDNDLPPYQSLVGTRLADFIRWDAHDSPKELKKKIYHDIAANHNLIINLEVPCAYNDRLIWVLVNGEPYYNADGSFAGYRGNFLNITKSHSQNQILRKAKENAEKASSASTRYLAEISHEIKTPLQAIMGLIEIVGNSENITEEQRGYLKSVSQSASVLQNILHDVLDFSHISSQTMIMEKINYNIRDTVSSVVRQMEGRAHDKGIELTLKFGDSFPVMVVGDAHRLSQIFYNLINNAIKFTAKGGVSVLAERFENRLKFSVQDSGPGIPGAKLKNLFTPFQQLDGSISRKYGGSGLGLAISKRLVECMDGKIGIKTELGKGSTFWFEIPCLVARNELIGATSVRKSRKILDVHFNILLVEDSRINQFVLKTMLENLGHRVRVAGNGEEAVVSVFQELPELILMDIRMPVMDGIQATRKILSRYRSLPIVALTANSSDEERHDCHVAGMIDLLSKPVNSETLKNKLQELSEIIIEKNRNLKEEIRENRLVNHGSDEPRQDSEGGVGSFSSSAEESNLGLIADIVKKSHRGSASNQRIEIIE